jgi:glutathione synthase/RimK-type ligase-like ATP-grasp enzyme
VKERVLIEEWIPKASMDNKVFDFRILTINGKARHTVVRTSRHPVTNLHLGNRRGNLEELETLIGSDKINEVKTLAEKASLCFADSLYAGVDILLSNDLSVSKVLEVNAFGDLLPGINHNGESTYEAEINAMKEKISVLW